MNLWEWGKSLECGNSDGGNLENPVGDYRLDNHELEEEMQVNTEIGENQLGRLQYKLGRGNGKYNRHSSHKIEQAIPGMRKGIQRRETYNNYGDDARIVEIKELECLGTFIRALSTDVPRDGVCIDGSFAYTMKNKPLGSGHI